MASGPTWHETATARGYIQGYASRDFVIQAGAGQTLTVSLEASSPSAYFNLLRPGSSEVAMFIGSTSGHRYQGVAPIAGDYTVRAYVIEEANTISTTYDRADLLPEPHRATVKGLIRTYLGERIASDRADSGPQVRETHRRRAAELQREIWAGAEIGCRAAGSSCAILPCRR